MSNKVIIFGIQDYAELAHYYLTHDSIYEVVAFCVNEKYIPDNRFFHGLPIVPLEEILDVYPPEEYKFFAPMSPKGMNLLRAEIYNYLKSAGYELISYISSRATIFNNTIGDNCFILENNTLQPYTSIGSNVVLWSGNHIGHHGIIANHVTVTSHAVISGHCTIQEYSFLGVNCAVRDGVVITEGSLIGMGAVITNSTEAWCAYVGNPGKKIEGKSTKDLL